jgi:hypothetical protein
MQYNPYEYNGKTYHAAEGKITWPLDYYHLSNDGKKLVKQLPCPCGCGLPILVNVHSGNCIEATLYLTYACLARATLNVYELGEWTVDIEEGTGKKYIKTPSGTFLMEGLYPPPHSYHLADDAVRIIPDLVGRCGCGTACSSYCEHGNCKGATLYLTFSCAAEGELQIKDEGFWEFDVESQEAHEKPFKCN